VSFLDFFGAAQERAGIVGWAKRSVPTNLDTDHDGGQGAPHQQRQRAAGDAPLHTLRPSLAMTDIRKTAAGVATDGR
jgi:hypothetical protein